MRDRSAFGYLEPTPDIEDFAQCSSCQLWIKKARRCWWLQPNDEVIAGGTCIEYAQGRPIEDDVDPVGAFTKGEVGYIEAPVRCENCVSFDEKAVACDLYHKLNRELPKIFSLNANIKPRACCNAFDP